MRYSWFLKIGLLVGALLFVVVAPPHLFHMNTPKSGDTVKELGLQFFDLTGREIRLESFKGKYLILNSWASWCPFCATELAAFAKLHHEMGDRFVVVAVNRFEPENMVLRFAESIKARGDITFVLDPNDVFYRQLQGTSMPETLFITPQGRIQYHKIGPMDLNEVRTRVQQLLMDGESV